MAQRRADYSSVSAVSKGVADQFSIGRVTVRRTKCTQTPHVLAGEEQVKGNLKCLRHAMKVLGPVSARPGGSYRERMNLEFSGEMWFWKGPAPWHFITVPEEECGELEATSASVTYGWGMIPVTAQIGGTRWKTSLFPKGERYIVPVKAWVRKAEGLELSDTVRVRLAVDV